MHSITPGSIVVGVDGSDSSQRALEWAVREAVAEHRPLTLVHSIHAVTPAYIDAAIVNATDARSALTTSGKEVLAHARHHAERAAPELEVHEVFDLADPRELLLQLAEDAPMVVVGSRGRGPVRSLLLGSVSVAMIRHVRCPVVVVRPGNPGTVRNGVVAGVDAAPESQPVIEFAFRQASLHDLPLTVINSPWDLVRGRAGGYTVADLTGDVEPDRLALAEALAGMGEKYPDVHVTTRVVMEPAAKALVELSPRSDLIVIGAHQRNRLSQAVLGSVSVEVVEHAQCPVAVVPLSTTP